MNRLFITGVGTGVGKTLVTTILGHQLRAMGRSVSALKPVVSGYVEDDPDSDPVLILRSLGLGPSPEAIVAISPWRFEAPISPHLAARRECRPVVLDEVVRFCNQCAGRHETIQLIEGAGGVMSPITSDATCLDVIATLRCPAILVTGTYLGALSHTLTALDALRGRGVSTRGIVVSESSDSMGLDDTVEALRSYGAADVPIHLLPRQAGDPSTRWLSAPLLTRICEADRD